MRQTLKDENYFRKLTGELEREIEIIKSDILEFEKNNAFYKKHLINYELFTTQILIAQSKYSVGDSLLEVADEIRIMINYLTNSFQQNFDYSKGGGIGLFEITEAIGMGIIANCNKELQRLSDQLLQVDFIDSVLGNLLESFDYPVNSNNNIPGSKSKFYLFLNSLSSLPKTSAEEKIKEFLEKQYYTKSNLDEAFNSHKKEQGYIYSGYWSWETAAIAKLKELDDSSFKDNPYYPYEMVHF